MNTATFFDLYYNNAELNSIMIMDCDGKVLDVNRAFTNNFGYSNEEIRGFNFNILFNKNDREKNKPQLEIESVKAKGQAYDENYVIDNKGLAIWCTGESLLVSSEEGENYIVKDIVNLQARKQLQLFLIETEELLERIFESSKDISMIILDGSMKIIKVNTAFLNLFNITETPAAGSRLSDLRHPFWNSTDIKKVLSKMLVTNEQLKHKEFSFEGTLSKNKVVRVESKIIEKPIGMGRKIFIIIEDVTPL